MSEVSTDHRRAVAERNVEAILDAMERLLERGVQPSITAVAGEAGLSRVTVYAHFSTLEELQAAVVERTVNRTAVLIEAAKPQEGSALDALDRVIAVAWSAIDQHSAMAQASSELLGAEAMAHAHRAGLAHVEKLVVRGRREGVFRKDLPVAWMVASLFALMHAYGDMVRAGALASEDAVRVLRTTIHGVVRPD